MTNKFSKQLSDEKIRGELAEQKLRADLELLVGSFQSYKVFIFIFCPKVLNVKIEVVLNRFESIDSLNN